MVELKYLQSKYSYRMIPFIRERGKKVIVESQRFKYLGEIAGLNLIVYEILECDNKLGSDAIFDLIYEC